VKKKRERLKREREIDRGEVQHFSCLVVVRKREERV